MSVAASRPDHARPEGDESYPEPSRKVTGPPARHWRLAKIKRVTPPCTSVNLPAATDNVQQVDQRDPNNPLLPSLIAATQTFTPNGTHATNMGSRSITSEVTDESLR